jgi:hypothetical protein
MLKFIGATIAMSQIGALFVALAGLWRVAMIFSRRALEALGIR